MAKQTDLFELFGISQETLLKSKDILPTLDMGKLKVGSRIILSFLDDLPKIVEVENKFLKKKVSTRVIRVHVDTIFSADDNGKLLEISINENYSMWLSSKSMSLGILKLLDGKTSLKNIKASINIGLAEYKEYGENRCYSVHLIQ